MDSRSPMALPASSTRGHALERPRRRRPWPADRQPRWRRWCRVRHTRPRRAVRRPRQACRAAPSGLPRRSLGEGGHGGDCSLAFHLGDDRATARAATEMVLHQEAAAGAKFIAQIGLKLRGGTPNRQRCRRSRSSPNPRSRCLDLAGVHAFRSHLVECSFQTVFDITTPS